MSWFSSAKEESKKAPTSTQPQRTLKTPEPPKVVSQQGKVVVTKVIPAGRHAFLTRYDGKGEVFLSFDVVEAKGFKNLAIGQVFEVTWVKSAKKKGRLDVTELRPG